MYCGENCLALEKGGDSIRALQESKKCKSQYHNKFFFTKFCIYLDYEKASVLCKEYSKMKGVAKAAKPERHLFFRKLAPIIQRTLEKCERENGFM